MYTYYLTGEIVFQFYRIIFAVLEEHFWWKVWCCFAQWARALRLASSAGQGSLVGGRMEVVKRASLSCIVNVGILPAIKPGRTLPATRVHYTSFVTRAGLC